MTLGRSSTGAIKIKTDGGLRAVECACCGGCVCSLQIQEPLLSVLRNATTGTCNGVAPISFNAQGGGFFAYFDLGNYIYFTASLQANAPCLILSSLDFNGIQAVPDPTCCPGISFYPFYCEPADNMRVNGIEFPAVHIIYEANEARLPSPEFVFW